MILVCGGAGYIGSHLVRELIRRGRRTAVVDNLRSGHRAAVDPGAEFFPGDIRDQAFLEDLFRRRPIETVFHFAADSLVGQSMIRPLEYFDNNVHGTLSLVRAMVGRGVMKIVFSSSAAVYGQPARPRALTEDDETRPVNPYGASKLMMEEIMRWAAPAHGLRYAALRYFNVAGAADDGSLGEDHRPETHLIPLALRTALGQREHLELFGADYDTPDGTCIRDYLPIGDLVAAHLLAGDHLDRGGSGGVFNLGYGRGFSVREVIAAVERVTGRLLKVVTRERRPGDPDRLVAESRRAELVLGWRPGRAELEEIVDSAWRWHRLHPHGFESAPL